MFHFRNEQQLQISSKQLSNVCWKISLMSRTMLSFSKQCSPQKVDSQNQTMHQAKHPCFMYFKREGQLLNISLNLDPWTKWLPVATMGYMHMWTLPSNSVPSENCPVCAIQVIPTLSTKYKWGQSGESFSRDSPNLKIFSIFTIYSIIPRFKILSTAKEIQMLPFP